MLRTLIQSKLQALRWFQGRSEVWEFSWELKTAGRIQFA
jgi:hypothetical protein